MGWNHKGKGKGKGNKTSGDNGWFYDQWYGWSFSPPPSPAVIEAKGVPSTGTMLVPSNLDPVAKKILALSSKVNGHIAITAAQVKELLGELNFKPPQQTSQAQHRGIPAPSEDKHIVWTCTCGTTHHNASKSHCRSCKAPRAGWVAPTTAATEDSQPRPKVNHFTTLSNAVDALEVALGGEEPTPAADMMLEDGQDAVMNHLPPLQQDIANQIDYLQSLEFPDPLTIAFLQERLDKLTAQSQAEQRCLTPEAKGNGLISLRRWEAAIRARHSREKGERANQIATATAEAKEAFTKLKRLKDEDSAAELALSKAIARAERLSTSLDQQKARHADATEATTKVAEIRDLAARQTHITAANQKLIDKFGEEAVLEISGSFAAGMVSAQAALVPIEEPVTEDLTDEGDADLWASIMADGDAAT
jgi:hypothetical protein